jgi:hypothetical protein
MTLPPASFLDPYQRTGTCSEMVGSLVVTRAPRPSPSALPNHLLRSTGQHTELPASLESSLSRCWRVEWWRRRMEYSAGMYN